MSRLGLGWLVRLRAWASSKVRLMVGQIAVAHWRSAIPLTPACNVACSNTAARSNSGAQRDLYDSGQGKKHTGRDPIPVPTSRVEAGSLSGVEVWMVIMTKTLLLE